MTVDTHFKVQLKFETHTQVWPASHKKRCKNRWAPNLIVALLCCCCRASLFGYSNFMHCQRTTTNGTSKYVRGGFGQEPAGHTIQFNAMRTARLFGFLVQVEGQ